MPAGDLEQQRAAPGWRGRSAPTAPPAPQVGARDPIPAAPLTAAFSAVAATDAASRSQASTGAQPSRAAAIASTPVPQPQSASAPAGSSSSSSSRHSRVVWCAPVPKACPGSITRSMPSPASGGSHGGRTRSRRKRQDTSTGLWNAFQRSDQSSGISDVGDVDERRARRRADVAEGPAPRPGRRRGRTPPRPPPPRAPRGRPARARAARPAPPPRRRAPRAPPAGSRPLQHDRRPLAEHAALHLPPCRTRRHLAGAPGQEARRKSRSGGFSMRHVQEQLERQVGDHGRRPRRGRLGEVGPRAPRPATPFAAALARIASSPSGITSTAVTGAQPRRAAATASTPVPAPQSHSAPPGSASSRSSRHSCVVGCVPAPKSAPGSITRSSSPPSSHGGRTRRSPTRDGPQELVPARLPAGGHVGERDGEHVVARQRADVALGRELGPRRVDARTPPRRAPARSPPPRRAAAAAARRARAPPARGGPGCRAARAAGRSPCQRALELGEHALVLAEVALGERVGELVQQPRCSTQPGEVITMRARGMPAGRRSRTGDLHVHVNVVIPRRLSKRAARRCCTSSPTRSRSATSARTRACSQAQAHACASERPAARAARHPGPPRAGRAGARGAAAAAARGGGGDRAGARRGRVRRLRAAGGAPGRARHPRAGRRRRARRDAHRRRGRLGDALARVPAAGRRSATCACGRRGWRAGRTTS